MERPSDPNAIALAGVLAAAACVFAALAAITDIWGNPFADVALGCVVIAMGYAAARAYKIPVFGRRKANGISRMEMDPPASNRAIPDDGTGCPAESEERGRTAGHGHGDVRAPAQASDPDRDERLVTAERTPRWIGPDIDANLPLIEECLELRLAGGGLRSRRVTQGAPQDEVRVAPPSWEMAQDYRQALTEVVGIGGSADEAAFSQVSRLGAALQVSLLQAVPESARRRLTAAGAGKARQLAAIELRLLDRRLETYPWELLADPDMLRTSTAGIAVWRSVPAPLRPVYRSWTGNLLLTGTPLPLGGRPPTDDELTWIKSDLNRCGRLRVCLSRGIPASFGPLMAEHPPAAFHLVAHETGAGPPPGTTGPALTEPDALPGLTAPGLARAGTWLAVFSCRDSATVPPGGRQSPGYEIADASGAAVIGMAGPVPPYPSGLFATALYRCLAAGFSALHAYHEAVCRVRQHDPRSSTMWSIPVMYAETSNVVPFPVSDAAKVRLSLVYFRCHAEALDRELAALAGGNIRSDGDWAKRTATPSVRITCIKNYLSAALADGADLTGGPRQQHATEAQRDLEEALSATRRTLKLLGGTRDAARRQQALQDLLVCRTRHQMILQRLDELIGEAG